MNLSDLDTPSLIVDLDIMEDNLQRASEYTKEHSLRFRPHAKTHKIPELARRQLDLGAAGITVAKVSEAEVLEEARPEDFLIAYPVIGEKKLQRLTRLAGRVSTTVALDSREAANELSNAARAAGVEIGVLVEMDVGFGRVGVDPSAVPQLATYVRSLPFLRLEGIEFFPGHISPDVAGGMAALESLGRCIQRVSRALEHERIHMRVVSGGSTPTLYYSHLIPEMNEIRSGTYIFNDRNTVELGGCSIAQCGASILTTVVSVARPGQIIVDSGSKALSSDLLVRSETQSYGYIPDAPGAVCFRLTEEHGFINIEKSGRSFRVGDRLRIIPNHVCVTVNLHERIYGLRGDMVSEIWEVKARSKLQ